MHRSLLLFDFNQKRIVSANFGEVLQFKFNENPLSGSLIVRLYANIHRYRQTDMAKLVDIHA